MGVKAKAEGELVVKSGSAAEIIFYEEDVILSDEVKSEGEARRLLKGGLIDDILRKKYDNFKRTRTCQVVEITEVKEKPENDELQLLLIEATKLDCVPENIENYKRPDYKVKALEKAIARAKERMEKQKKKEFKENAHIQNKGYVD